MVKRIVDTAFWTDMLVIDNFSVEDKYFSLYLMTNDKSTQVGIYALPKKVMSFETGFTADVIQVLLDRFNKSYNKILYSEKTQEITLLKSLEYSILTGGKPVSDLLERELTNVKDGELILATYHEMKNFWDLSKRKFDQTIKELFENELSIRGLFSNQKHNETQKQKQNQIQNDNQNHNQESHSTTRDTTRADDDETALLERYTNYLKQFNPELNNKITLENIVIIYYQHLFGEMLPHVENQLKQWEMKLSKSLVLEALTRSTKAHSPLLYAASIIENWIETGATTYKDVMRLDEKFNKEKY